MEICKQKNFFVIKVSLPWEWYGTFDETLHYKSLPLPPFSTNNQTGRGILNPQHTLLEALAALRVWKAFIASRVQPKASFFCWSVRNLCITWYKPPIIPSKTQKPHNSLGFWGISHCSIAITIPYPLPPLVLLWHGCNIPLQLALHHNFTPLTNKQWASNIPTTKDRSY